MVLYCHTKTRYLSAWYSTFTQWHGTCPCCTLLPPRHTVYVPVVLDCHQETEPVHVVLSCQPETRDLSLWYSSVLMSPRYTGNSPCATLLSPRYTIQVPVVLYCHPETWCLSLWFSTVSHRHGTLLYCHTKIRHGICPCAVLLSNRSARMMSIFQGT